MSRKVSYARLHQAAYAPLVGELGNTFPPNGGKTLDGLEMHTTPDGLELVFSYKANKGINLLIPYANVIAMSLVPEAQVAKAAAPGKSK